MQSPEVIALLPILEQEFVVPTNRPDLDPLERFHEQNYRLHFMHEVTLTARLDASILLALDRLLLLLKHHNHYPAGHYPVVTDIGANGFCRPVVDDEGRLTGNKFEPDRCTQDANSAGQPDAINRCPGDVKCSWKFQGNWRPWIGSKGKGYKPLGDEYRNVMAQLRWYMADIGLQEPRGGGGKRWGATYGYIITDQEVVLVKRVPTGEDTLALYATPGFPLRSAEEGQINGLLALLIIHLLASKDDYKTENGAFDR